MADSSVIEDVTEADLARLCDLNEAHVPHVNSLSLEQLTVLWQMSAYFRLVREGDEILACLLVLGPGEDYSSLNYTWFSSRYEDFLYIDRVMVSEAARRRGLASRLYEDLFSFGSLNKVPNVLCEFNLEPPNPISQQFHESHGFLEVGQQRTEGGEKMVSLQCKTVSV